MRLPITRHPPVSEVIRTEDEIARQWEADAAGLPFRHEEDVLAHAERERAERERNAAILQAEYDGDHAALRALKGEA